MIAGTKLKLTPMRAVAKTAHDPETGQLVAVETREELHLFMEPGGYCKHTDGVWNVQPPSRNAPVYRLLPGKRTVTEHDDGTITVAEPFLARDGGWRLEQGNWIPLPPAKG